MSLDTSRDTAEAEVSEDATEYTQCCPGCGCGFYCEHEEYPEDREFQYCCQACDLEFNTLAWREWGDPDAPRIIGTRPTDAAVSETGGGIE